MRPAVDPTLSRLSPETVPVNWAGTLKVQGANFTADSVVMIDGAVPKTVFVGQTELEAMLTAANTATAGKKEVKVHELNTGSISNALILMVS